MLKVLLDGGHLHGDTLALSGRTLEEALGAAPGRRRGRAHDSRRAIIATGGVVVLKGNLAPTAR